MSKKTVLYIAHNHPSVRPGGAETYALELYESFREAEGFNSYFLAKSGPPMSGSGLAHGGTHIGHFNRDPHQYYLHTESFDWFYGVQPAKLILTQHFRDFLKAIQPDIVHFQHTLFLGYDMIREVRNTLPNAAIVYTLHEYLPICHRQGQMLRATDNSPCMEESPMRCNTCFPQHSPQDFFLRKKMVQSQFALVDKFIAPCRFLLERYVDWGLSRDRIVFEEYGRHPMRRVEETTERSVKNRFTFFGQISPYKGVDVLLDGMRLLAEQRAEEAEISFEPPTGADAVRPHLRICGANLDLQEGPFQKRIYSLLETTRRDVTLIGRYTPAQLPGLMSETDWVIVPSIWWENSPLVIQEAFAHGRPVICSDIGGMAEKVRNGVDGLHFRAGDAVSLAETIRRAATTPGLWEKLAANIAPVHPMPQHQTFMANLYHQILETKSQGRVA